MPSPFPGMNPYMEFPGTWKSVHNALLITAKHQLVPKVPPPYFIDAEFRLWFAADGEVGATQREADIGLSIAASPHAGNGQGGTAVATAAATDTALRFPMTVEPIEEEMFLQIYDTRGWDVVTVVELLSPANKDPSKQAEFLRKRQEVWHTHSNYVEIDLLRAHGRVALPALPRSDYAAFIRRPEEEFCQGWTWNLRDPIPPIPLPLRPGEPDVVLDLQAVLHEVYDRGGYERAVYHFAPVPPLPAGDAAWAAEVLRDARVTTRL